MTRDGLDVQLKKKESQIGSRACENALEVSMLLNAVQPVYVNRVPLSTFFQNARG